MDTKKYMKAEYFAEATDDKISGTIIARRDTICAVYSVPGNSRRSMILTEQGLKFCLKGKPETFLQDGDIGSNLLNEEVAAPV